MSTLRSNKKQGKRRVVVNNRLIDTSMKILRSLTPESRIVEEVRKQTGLSDRSYFFKTKNALIRRKLIKETRLDRRAFKLELDETGRDLAMLAYYIERAHECYQTLQRAIREKFKISEYHLIRREMALAATHEKANQMRMALRGKLRNLGWDSSDLKSYNEWVLDALFFERKTASAYVIALCSKYAFFLSKIGNNEIARPILHKIISDAFDEHFSVNTGVFTNNMILTDDSEKKAKIESNAALMISSLNHPVYKYIKEYAYLDESKIYLPPYDISPKITNRFLTEVSKDTVRSIFHIYGLGSEQTNNEFSELIERYNQTRDNSADPL
jgi:hypothetical protein